VARIGAMRSSGVALTLTLSVHDGRGDGAGAVTFGSPLRQGEGSRQTAIAWTGAEA